MFGHRVTIKGSSITKKMVNTVQILKAIKLGRRHICLPMLSLVNHSYLSICGLSICHANIGLVCLGMSKNNYILATSKRVIVSIIYLIWRETAVGGWNFESDGRPAWHGWHLKIPKGLRVSTSHVQSPILGTCTGLPYCIYYRMYSGWLLEHFWC